MKPELDEPDGDGPEAADHRALGAHQDLFHFSEDAPGMVFWHPRGWALMRALEAEVRARLSAEGFEEIRTPQLLRRRVWERSQHWRCFRSGLFVVGEDGGLEAALKPVSCPGHLDVAARRALSYRDLPLRLAELGLVHRDEPSGALHGLLRLRQFTQDDGHILLPEEGVPEEVARFVGSLRTFYRSVGFDDVEVAFSSRPEDRAGRDEDWDRAEHALREAAARAGLSSLVEQPGAGAFYGPKLEFILTDRLGRAWQAGTIQLDLFLPRRFGVRYVDRDGARRVPAMLHRAMLGSLERFVGVLLEHHGGRLPAHLAPEQVVVASVSRGVAAYAAEVLAAARGAGLRARLDARDEPLGRKVRDAHALGVPFLLVVGPRERRARRVALRAGSDRSEAPLDEAIVGLLAACAPPAPLP